MNFKKTTYKFYNSWREAILAVAVILLVVLLFLFQQEKEPELFLVLRPNSEEFSVGETPSLSVYLEGKQAGRVIGLEFRLNFDATAVELLSAEPGPFFDQPLVVKWDEAEGSFALAKNPALSGPAGNAGNPNLSVARLKFLVKEPAQGVVISFEQGLAYVSGYGGVYPEGLPGYYELNAK